MRKPRTEDYIGDIQTYVRHLIAWRRNQEAKAEGNKELLERLADAYDLLDALGAIEAEKVVPIKKQA